MNSSLENRRESIDLLIRSSLSPSVICQLESALQTVPPPLISRAVAGSTGALILGEHLAAGPESRPAPHLAWAWARMRPLRPLLPWSRETTV